MAHYYQAVVITNVMMMMIMIMMMMMIIIIIIIINSLSKGNQNSFLCGFVSFLNLPCFVIQLIT
jgi:hypothetical protein